MELMDTDLERAYREMLAREQAQQDMLYGAAVAILLETLPEEER